MSNLVLIVDDDCTTQLLLQELLKTAGYSPIICSDGSTALEMMQVLEYQLVVLDINLPGISGWDILSYIKAECHRTSVLLLTGSSDEKTKEYEESTQRDKYYSIVYKPIERSSFLQTVQKLVENSMTKNKKRTIYEFNLDERATGK